MSKLQECIEYLQTSNGAGVFTDENLQEVGFAERVLIVGRAICIPELHKNSNFISELYFQDIDLVLDTELQEDDCYRLFSYPAVIPVNSEIDGHQYLGAKRGDNGWRRMMSHAAWSNFKHARGTRRIDESTYYLFEPSYEMVKVFDGDVEKGHGRSIFHNPLHPLLKFNRQQDEFPITEECLALVEKYYREGKLQENLRQPTEIISNSASDLAIAKTGQQ